MSIDELRKEYQHQICDQIIRIQRSGHNEYPNFADGSNKHSCDISWGIVNQLRCSQNYQMIKGQTAGSRFEQITRDFIRDVFDKLVHLRPGKWHHSIQAKISEFEQFEHLAYLEEAIRSDRKLEAALRGDYIIIPDIVISRSPVSDQEINQEGALVTPTDASAHLTPLRERNREGEMKILHASISCKWTIRSDRAQNTRTEALNLIRNRKGPLPHVVAVTAEPTPHRLMSLALGTGDLDCVYHFALHELVQTIHDLKLDDASDEINMMIEGKRLRDVSDLPFDLII